MTLVSPIIRQLLAWRPPRLRFDHRRERRFLRSRAEARLEHYVASGLVALIAYNLYLLSDRIMVPDMFEQALRMRLFMLTPTALLLMVVALRRKAWVLSQPTWVVEAAVLLMGVFASLTLGVVLTQTTSPFGIMYRVGLVPVLIYGNLVQRFRFKYALALSAFVLLVCLASMTVIPTNHPYERLDIPVTLFVFVIAVYSLIMNYRMELDERQRYLRTERAAVLRQEINASRLALDEMSRHDPLTGAPNRRHVDEVMNQVWADHRQAQASVALLLIDVDHFKAYNDRYGHPTGDQCLRHVAQALQASVPTPDACVARWGGEEFIVVLPHTDAERARLAAQALVDAVTALRLRHEASPTAPHVTISAGVAAAVPGRVLSSTDELIAKADTALYRAKAAGRHRCDVT